MEIEKMLNKWYPKEFIDQAQPLGMNAKRAISLRGHYRYGEPKANDQCRDYCNENLPMIGEINVISVGP